MSIPSRWIRVSDTATRDGFKYQDYFLSIGRDEEHPMDIAETTKVEQIISQTRFYPQTLDIDALLEVCPFREKGLTDVAQLYLPSSNDTLLAP